MTLANVIIQYFNTDLQWCSQGMKFQWKIKAGNLDYTIKCGNAKSSFCLILESVLFYVIIIFKRWFFLCMYVHTYICIYTHVSKFLISLENLIFKALMRKICLHLWKYNCFSSKSSSTGSQDKRLNNFICVMGVANRQWSHYQANFNEFL